MKTLSVKGTIFSGKGEAAKFIRLPWVRKQIVEKLGFNSYLGTLNLRLTRNNIKINRILRKADGFEILPAPGFCRGKLFKAYLFDDVKCAVVIPEVAGYPEDLLEIIAVENLKETLGLKDSDEVKVKISL